MTRRELEITDRREIRDILDRCGVVHIGMVDGGEPYVVPMNYGYTMDDDGRLSLFIHGATQGRKIDVMRANPRVFVEMECDLEPFSGDVACRYGLAYRSLMGRGKAVFVDDPVEKAAALNHLMRTQMGKGDFEFTEKLVKVVAVIRIDVEEYTAKRRPVPKR
ncbi:MAG: pyridoxamine 5'-phosphate oxidase family protein [Ruminococcaceae bacterium]|nr:pyridoxamine 5'-phosphate oxidase family protein [Oscillospiraceae bacterium]